MYVVRTGHPDSGHAAGADAQGGRGSARGARRWRRSRPEGMAPVLRKNRLFSPPLPADSQKPAGNCCSPAHIFTHMHSSQEQPLKPAATRPWATLRAGSRPEAPLGHVTSGLRRAAHSAAAAQRQLARTGSTQALQAVCSAAATKYSRTRGGRCPHGPEQLDQDAQHARAQQRARRRWAGRAASGRCCCIKNPCEAKYY